MELVTLQLIRLDLKTKKGAVMPRLRRWINSLAEDESLDLKAVIVFILLGGLYALVAIYVAPLLQDSPLTWVLMLLEILAIAYFAIKNKQPIG